MSNYYIDYEKVLADLEAKRDALNSAIDGIKKLLGVSAQVSPDGTFKPAIGQSSETTEIASDAFFGMSIPDAIEKYLRIMRRPQDYHAISDALESGGITHSSKVFSKSVNTTLDRISKVPDAKIVKVNGKWGLAEWYPGAKRSALVPRREEGRESSEHNEDYGETEEPPVKTDAAIIPEQPSLPIEPEPPVQQFDSAA